MNFSRAFAVLALAGVFAGAHASAAAPGGKSPQSSASARKVSGPALRSSAAFVLDVSRSSVLYARNADSPMPIASITKLMTSLVVADAGQPLDEMLEITDEDKARGKGAFSRLLVGTKLTRGDLMHLALMSSENRAAHALGRNYPGGPNAFVRAMNARAKELGMVHARFVDPAGLSSLNVASPRDLTRLVLAASANPVIRHYSTDRAHTVKVGRQMLEFRNTNTLVSNPTWDITVQKTGFINEAGQCLVMQAVIDERPVVIVLLNSFGKYTRVADARRVRKWMESQPAATDARTSGGPTRPESVRTRS